MSLRNGEGPVHPRGVNEYVHPPRVNRLVNRLVNDHGAILLIVLIVLLTIALVGAALMALFFNVLTIGRMELDRAQALYLAEAGVAKAIYMLKGQAGVGFSVGSQQIIPPTALGDGFYEVYNDFSQSTIIATGISHGVKRTIQVRYNAF